MTEPSDEERLAGIRETMSLYRHARERGFKNAGPGLDTLYYDHADLLLRLLDQRDERIRRLEAALNSPETQDFLVGVQREAAHQAQRWGESHDRSKSSENWYWLVGYLAGKALRASIEGDREKALHHTISAAAALSQWHSAIKIGHPTGLAADEDLAVLDAANGERAMRAKRSVLIGLIRDLHRAVVIEASGGEGDPSTQWTVSVLRRAEKVLRDEADQDVTR